jgi:hypothetical protein
MPPPTRLGLLLSRTLFASLKEEGFGTGWAAGFGGGAGMVEGVVPLPGAFNGRDETGFIKSGASAVLGFGAGFETVLAVEDEDAFGTSTGAGVDRRPSASTIVIGTLRRFGVGFEETSTGAVLGFWRRV